MSTLLEICVDSIESAFAAREGGADRLEVCSCLATGGTTPSVGLVKQCVDDIQLPVMMMIRAHNGAFLYQDHDINSMLTDIEVAHSLGVRGVVFGALTKARHVHYEHCQQLLKAAGSMETTFHRAFDVVANPVEAFDQIVEMGFNRLLTSGQAASAEEGVSLIRQLCDRSQDRIVVLAGAGVNSGNAQKIVAATGVRELHASASTPVHAQPYGNIGFGIDRRVTTAQLVRAIRRSLD